MGDEGHLPLVSILNADVVVSPSDIKFGEDLGIFHLVDEVLDQREGVGIFDSVHAGLLIVLAGSKGVRSVLLVNKEEGSCLRGVQGMYSS